MNLHLRPDCPLAAMSSSFPEGFPVVYASTGYLLDFDRVNVHQLLAIADHFSKSYAAFDLGETIKRLKRTGVAIPYSWAVNCGKAKEKTPQQTNDTATQPARISNRMLIPSALGK